MGVIEGKEDGDGVEEGEGTALVIAQAKLPKGWMETPWPKGAPTGETKVGDTNEVWVNAGKRSHRKGGILLAGRGLVLCRPSSPLDSARQSSGGVSDKRYHCHKAGCMGTYVNPKSTYLPLEIKKGVRRETSSSPGWGPRTGC